MGGIGSLAKVRREADALPSEADRSQKRALRTRSAIGSYCTPVLALVRAEVGNTKYIGGA